MVDRGEWHVQELPCALEMLPEPQPAFRWSSASPDQNHKVLLAAVPRTLSHQARVLGSTLRSTLALWNGTSVVNAAALPVEIH